MTGEEQLVIWKSGNSMKEAVVTSSTMPLPVTVKAYERGTTNPLKINGADFVDVPLSVVKETKYLQISDGMFPYLVG